MIREGETLVELKRDIPSDGMGPTVASFANTLGGWIILGVDNDREVVGWKPPGRADDADYLRDVLRREVDPLPPFAARPVRVGRHRVSLIRVYESSDTPHLIRGTGAVFVRDPGAKRPIRDHAELIELARRGELAEERARARLGELSVPARFFATPDTRYRDRVPRHVRWVARAAPLTVAAATRDWPLTRSAADWCLATVDRMLPERPPYARTRAFIEPYGRAVVATVAQETHSDAQDRAELIADCGGVFGAKVVRGTIGDDTPTIFVGAMLDEELRPLAQTITSMLSAAEAHGRAIVDVWCQVPPGGQSSGGGARRGGQRDQLHAAREITVPTEPAEVNALAEAWHRELQRGLGIVKYEDTLDD